MARVTATWAKKPTYKSNNDDFYNSSKWRNFSRRFRRLYPLCQSCNNVGKITDGVVTDHIISINVGGAVWDERNCQSLCRACDQKKRSDESRGVILPYIGTYGNYLPRQN
jgi:5-methylcytosine-specific restriction endonuclease McrA